jgi:hypothetical protein
MYIPLGSHKALCPSPSSRVVCAPVERWASGAGGRVWGWVYRGCVGECAGCGGRRVTCSCYLCVSRARRCKFALRSRLSVAARLLLRRARQQADRDFWAYRASPVESGNCRRVLSGLRVLREEARLRKIQIVVGELLHETKVGIQKYKRSKLGDRGGLMRRAERDSVGFYRVPQAVAASSAPSYRAAGAHTGGNV